MIQAASQDSRAFLLAAAARCLLDELIDRTLARLGEGTEVIRLTPKPRRRRKADENGEEAEDRGAAQLVQEVLKNLETGSLFGAPRAVLVMGDAAILRDKQVQAWIRAPGSKSYLICALLKRGNDLNRVAPPKGLPVERLIEQAPRDLQQFCRQRAHPLVLTAEAMQRLQGLTGGDVDALSAEITKLRLYVGEGQIEGHHVDELVGRSAGQEFDRFWDALKAGRRGEALAFQHAMAADGLLLFGSGRLYGKRATAAALLPLLFTRIRRVALVGGSQGKLREAAMQAAKITSGYASFLARDARDLGTSRLQVWLAATTAAETAQKRTGQLSDDLLLYSLIIELTERT